MNGSRPNQSSQGSNAAGPDISDLVRELCRQAAELTNELRRQADANERIAAALEARLSRERTIPLTPAPDRDLAAPQPVSGDLAADPGSCRWLSTKQAAKRLRIRPKKLFALIGEVQDLPIKRVGTGTARPHYRWDERRLESWWAESGNALSAQVERK